MTKMKILRFTLVCIILVEVSCKIIYLVLGNVIFIVMISDTFIPPGPKVKSTETRLPFVVPSRENGVGRFTLVGDHPWTGEEGSDG